MKSRLRCALRPGEIFAGIEADVGFADVCGAVAAICHALAHGHRDIETIVALGGGAPSWLLADDAGRLSAASIARPG
jgi:hypothetical protein